MASKRDYTKDIIDEYNIRLQSWGNSDSWGLTEFKMLEDLIYESSKMRINANTLKRFFQQRTSNPQMATYNALCIFLGYSSYADFVMKKTQHEKEDLHKQKEETELPTPAVEEIKETVVAEELPVKKEEKKQLPKKKRSFYRRYRMTIYSIVIVLTGVIVFFLVTGWDGIKERRHERLISSVVFKSSNTKGASPYTVKVEYDIPEKLFEYISVVCVEANGDISTRKLTNGQHDFYATFIYPGKGICQLKYKDRIIRTIDVESRTSGWSAYIKEDRSDFYYLLPFGDVENRGGYITLPVSRIPEKAVTDKLFTSYTYYADSIIDGDNFIFEARVRNSQKEDYGIPCNDIMMYIFSDTGLHGFALNENCYSYLKFISSENTMTGDQYDLSRFNFNPSIWHVMRIEVIDKKTTFYLDGELVLQMDYKVSLGTANELTLRFKGCGALDYVKVIDPKTKKVVFQDDFDE